MAGLYIHLPVRKGHRAREQDAPGDAGEAEITAALSDEARLCAQRPTVTAPVSILYVGGGRPSLYSVDVVQTLADTVSHELGASALEEATVEISPADATPEYLTELHRHGVTRLSIGGISLVPEDLARTGAQHTRDDLVRTIQWSRDAGFESFSVDLHFGGAERPRSNWKASLHRAAELRVPHITLHERDLSGPSHNDDAHAERFAFAMTFLRSKGYEQYELTHFARPGHRSQYQECVYAHGNVLGLGPGAESFWWPDRSDPSMAQRWSNVEDTAAYVERLRSDEAPVEQHQVLDQPALAREYILLRLRTSEGLDLDVLNKRYGVALHDRRAAALDRLAEEGLIHDDPNRVRLTPRGRLLADAITQRLIREG